MTRVLVVEDSEDLAYGLANNLEIEGYEVRVEIDGESGLAAARTGSFDLVVLDLMLPGLDGFRVLRSLRDDGVDVPVLILSARGEEVDKVRGFRLGADDYVTKPFGVLELLARVEALLRRTRRPDASFDAAEEFAFGEVEVDAHRRLVRRSGEEVTLAPKEYDLLLALLRHEGTVVSRNQLLQEVWGYAGQILTRTIDTHIAQLRRKLEPDAARPQHILTVHKVGYRFRS